MRGVCTVTGVLAAMLMSTLPAVGQETEKAAQEKEVEALKALGALYEKAINEGNLDLLEPHLDAEFSGIMITDEPVNTLDEMRAYWKKVWEMIGEGGTYQISLKPEKRWIFGDVAISKGTTEDYVRAASGNEYRFTASWTAVLVKREGQWKILRVQGSMDPLGNPFVKMFIGEASKMAGIVAGAITLIVGAAAGFFLGRRKPAKS